MAKDVSYAIKKHAKDSIVITVTNPSDLITYIDWATGTVYTGKDFDQTITALFSNPGSEVGIADSWENHSVVAFTNDPNKNNTADWWY